MKTKRVTKQQQVLDHLKSGKSITSLTAINLYGATRLSAIIFNLKELGHDIISERESRLDRNGNVCNYSRYQLKGVNPISVKEQLNNNPEIAPKPEPTKPKKDKNFFKKLWSKIL